MSNQVEQHFRTAAVIVGAFLATVVVALGGLWAYDNRAWLSRPPGEWLPRPEEEQADGKPAGWWADPPKSSFDWEQVQRNQEYWKRWQEEQARGMSQPVIPSPPGGPSSVLPRGNSPVSPSVPPYGGPRR